MRPDRELEVERRDERLRPEAGAHEDRVGLDRAEIGDRRAADRHASGQRVERAPDPQAARERVEDTAVPFVVARQERDPRLDVGARDGLDRRAGFPHRFRLRQLARRRDGRPRRLADQTARPSAGRRWRLVGRPCRRRWRLAGRRDDHEALLAEQPPGAELVLPRQPALARLERQRAQPGVAVSDPEDPAESRRLAGADALGLEHDHVRAAPLQLVRGCQPADSRSHDHHVHPGIVGFSGGRPAGDRRRPRGRDPPADLGRGPALAPARAQRPARRGRRRPPLLDPDARDGAGRGGLARRPRAAARARPRRRAAQRRPRHDPSRLPADPPWRRAARLPVGDRRRPPAHRRRAREPRARWGGGGREPVGAATATPTSASAAPARSSTRCCAGRNRSSRRPCAGRRPAPMRSRSRTWRWSGCAGAAPICVATGDALLARDPMHFTRALAAAGCERRR